MAISSFTPPPVPFDAPAGVRQYLDEQMRRLQVLVNGAAQREEAETITGAWTFTFPPTISRAVPVLRWEETDAATDQKNWLVQLSNGSWRLGTASDGSPFSLAEIGLDLLRSGTSITEIRIDAPVVRMRHGSLYLDEKASAGATGSGRGQLWVKNTTPCELWFTDDAGNDHQVAFV